MAEIATNSDFNVSPSLIKALLIHPLNYLLLITRQVKDAIWERDS